MSDAVLTEKDAELAHRLGHLGIVYPIRTVMAARWAGVPIDLACAFLEMETSGGINEFGHDPTIFAGAGEVTEAKYKAYVLERNKTGKCQGVGPMQLTSRGYQDEADRMGGCWRILVNLKVGFKGVKDLLRSHRTTHAAIAAYNGSGPAAEHYADEVLALAARWRTRIGPDA